MSPNTSYDQQPFLQRSYSQEKPKGYGQEQQPSRGVYDSQPARAPYDISPVPPQQKNSYGAQNSYGAREPQPYSYSNTPTSSSRPEAPPSYSQTFPRRQASYDRQPSNDRNQPQYERSPYNNDGYVSTSVFNQQAGVSDFGYEEPAGRSVLTEPQRSLPQPYRPAELSLIHI